MRIGLPNSRTAQPCSGLRRHVTGYRTVTNDDRFTAMAEAVPIVGPTIKITCTHIGKSVCCRGATQLTVCSRPLPSSSGANPAGELPDAHSCRARWRTRLGSSLDAVCRQGRKGSVDERVELRPDCRYRRALVRSRVVVVQSQRAVKSCSSRYFGTSLPGTYPDRESDLRAFWMAASSRSSRR